MFTDKIIAAVALALATTQAPAPIPLTDYIGTYADGPKHKIEIAGNAKGQLVAVIDDATYPLKVTGQDELTNNGGEKIPFKRGADGRISGYVDHNQFYQKLSPRVSAEAIAEI